VPVVAATFEPPRFHPARPDLVLPVRVDPTGEHGPTKPQARGRGWRRTSHGLVLPARFAPEPVEQRIVEAAAVLPRDGFVTGWAGLRWLGLRELDGTRGGARLPVPLLVPNHRIRPQPGFTVSAERMTRADRDVVDGLPVTSAVRSLCFELRYAAGLVAAVTLMDLAAGADLVSRQEAWDYTAEFLGTWTGVEQCRQAIALADENSWSRMETEMRLLWGEIGIRRILCNHPVFDLDGRHVGTPDLFDAEAGLVGEYDSELHLEGRRRAQDLRREGAFRRLGLEYVTMVTRDRDDPSDFLRRTLDARYRGLAAAHLPRRWTVVPPAWWTPTVTVTQRRALTDVQRSRFLRRRAS